MLFFFLRFSRLGLYDFIFCFSLLSAIEWPVRGFALCHLLYILFGSRSKSFFSFFVVVIKRKCFCLMWQQSHRILFNLHIRTCAHVFDYSPAKTDFPSCLPTITAPSCICLSSQCKFFLPHCSHRPCTFSTLTTPRSLLDYTSIVAINSKPVIGRMAHVLHIHFTVLVTCCLATTLSLPISQFLLLRWLWSALTRYVSFFLFQPGWRFSLRLWRTGCAPTHPPVISRCWPFSLPSFSSSSLAQLQHAGVDRSWPRPSLFVQRGSDGR